MLEIGPVFAQSYGVPSLNVTNKFTTAYSILRNGGEGKNHTGLKEKQQIDGEYTLIAQDTKDRCGHSRKAFKQLIQGPY